MKFETIIFDLDGTLIDSSRDITSGINFVLGKRGVRELTAHEVISCVGSGVTKLIEKIIALAGIDTFDGIREEFIEYYKDHLLDETTPYPGIEPLIETLSGNYNLAIATNKPLKLTKSIVKGMGFDNFFKVVVAPETTGVPKPSPKMLEAVGKIFETGPSETLMVGDSPVDIDAARNYGCKSAGVTWGYNIPEVLHETKPNYILNEPLDLLGYL